VSTSGSTSKFQRRGTDTPSKKESGSPQISSESSSNSGSDDGNRAPVMSFANKKPDNAEGGNGKKYAQNKTIIILEDKERKGFYRDEYFQKKIAQLREDKKRFILDLEYTYQHTEGLNAGEHVDPVYHKIYAEIKERKEQERESANKAKDNVQVEEEDSADGSPKKKFGQTAEQKEALKLTKKMTKTTDTTDESEMDENGNEAPRSFGKKKSEKLSDSGPGDEKEDSDSSATKDDETADDKPKKAFGKSFANKDEGAGEDEEVKNIRRRLEAHFESE
jgi:hypothetical protein